MHSQQPPGVVQNWSTLQCSKQNTEQCGYDHAPVTRGHMRAQLPLPHGHSHLSLHLVAEGQHRCCEKPLWPQAKRLHMGGPRTRLISKITGALGSLRTVIQWQRKEAGVQGNRLTASARRKAQRAVRLGALPQQVQRAWQAACRRMRKIGAAVRDDLLLQDFIALAPDLNLPPSVRCQPSRPCLSMTSSVH